MSSKRDPTPRPFQSDSRPVFDRRTLLCNGGLVLALQATCSWELRLWNGPADAAEIPVLGSPGCLATSRTAYPPILERFIAKLDPAADEFPAEVYVAEIEKLLAHWGDSICKSPANVMVMESDLAEGLAASSLEPSEILPLRTSGPLRIERRTFQGKEILGRGRFLTQFAAYLASFAAITVLEMEIYAARVAANSPLVMETEIRCNFVGKGKDGTAEQRNGSWILQWLQTGKAKWSIQKWVVNPEVRSILTGPGFTEITALCLPTDSPGVTQLRQGMNEWRTTLDGASGIDVYGNHGIAVGDIDGSGFDSFYVCQPSGLPNRLYRNRGDGTFEDITEQSGTGILDGTASALFADFQNRGMQDLLVVRTGGPLLFVNQGEGRFAARPDAFDFARPPQGTFTSVAAADYDRDGFLDVYFCVYSYYQGLNQYQFPSPYYDAQNGPPNFLFRNRGNGTFEDVTAKSGMNQNNNRFSFAASWCDYDNNGWPDLYVANDFGRKNLYRSNGDGTFKDVAAVSGVEDYGPGMSVCWLDIDNDGRQDLYVANMWLKEGKRITSDPHFLASVAPEVRTLYQKHNAGNSLYRNAGNGSFENKTMEAGSAIGGWSWSCAAWDFDNDGYPDLYVANGFVSGPNRFDLQSFFWRQVAQRSMDPAGASTEYEMAWNAVNELVRSDYSWSGYERNVFFTNNHDGTFSETAGVLGLDFIDDGRAVALSDFDHDGRLEFVLKNRTGPELRIVRNELVGIGNSIAIRLTGRTCNRDAIGATVRVETGTTRQTSFVSAGSGFASQHTKELFFGVGDTAETVSVSVLWPNGKSADFKNVPVNHRIQIEEDQQDFKATVFRPAVASPAKLVGSLKLLEAPATVSTWLIAPLFGPDVNLRGLNGKTRQVSTLRGNPVLLTFFRADCSESQTQLWKLEKDRSLLSGAGISVVPIAIGAGTDRSGGETLLQNIRSEFPILLADERAAGAWNIQYRYLFDRRRDMSLPTSFLLDKSGAIVRVYQGVLETKDLISDWKSAPNTPQARLARALPFAGPYYGNELDHNYLTYGIAFVEYGYLDEAQAAFQRAVVARPENAGAWFNLGTIYLNKKMYPEARRSLLECVRLNPQDADAWNNLGMISGEEGNLEEALQYFQKAARANPNYLTAVQNMIRIYEHQNRAADAQKILEELIASAPNNADLHMGLAMAMVAQNETQGAREELETAVRLRPGSTDALNNLGVVLLRLGKAQEALQRFDQCQKLSPDFDRPFLNAALIYNSAGQSAKARQMLEEFLGRHPDNAQVRSALDTMVSK